MIVPTIKVVCQNCSHEQLEPQGIISTVCGKCQAYIAVDQDAPEKIGEAPKRTRLIVCPHCEAPQKVYPHALTIMCVACTAHVNIANHTVSGRASHSLATYGEVTFSQGCRYSGAEVKAQIIHASGQLRTRLKAFSGLVFHHKTSVSGPVSADHIVISPGSKVTARRILGNTIEINGYLCLDHIVATKRLIVGHHGYLAAKTIKTPEVEVCRGGGLEGDFESIPLAVVGLGVPEIEVQ